MPLRTLGIFAAASLLASASCRGSPAEPVARPEGDVAPIALPAPRTSGSVSLEQAIARRRSIRSFTAERLTREELGQLLWAAQGVTEPSSGRRAAPSAGALFPLELYALTSDGVFWYRPAEHRMLRVREGDRRGALAEAALGQSAVASAAVTLVVTGVVARTRAKYGDRAERFVDLEAGHVAENVLLQATALGLGGVPIGALEEQRVRDVVGVSADETPIYLIAIGHPTT